MGFNGVVIDAGHHFETYPNYQKHLKISLKSVSLSQILRHCRRFKTPLNQNPEFQTSCSFLYFQKPGRASMATLLVQVGNPSAYHPHVSAIIFLTAIMTAMRVPYVVGTVLFMPKQI